MGRRPRQQIHSTRPPVESVRIEEQPHRAQFLHEPHRFVTQAELARKSGLSDGFVCKIIARLAEERYLEVNDARAVRPRDPNVLLDAWLDHYNFDLNRILIGRVPASSGEVVLYRTAGQLSREKISYAMTGVAGASLWTKFASFGQTNVYVPAMPSRALLKRIGFVEQLQDSNLAFVVPSDEGVFEASQQREGIQCASPLQTFLDLKGQPGQSAEAAVELRKKFLTWRRRGK